MNGVKVSVISPVYNQEKYLRQCLDSIVNQTLKDIEIICVDDGSTDTSLEILTEYASKDPRFVIVTQKNQYAGAARNNGINKAKGDYVVFWDSDDYFELTALEKMYKRIIQDDSDVCICGGKQYIESMDIEVYTDSYLKKDALPDSIPFKMEKENEKFFQITVEAAWNKMYKREFIENNNIRFGRQRNGNDILFTVRALCLADRIVVVDEPLVVYRKNPTGLVATVSKAPLAPFMEWESIAEEFCEKDNFPAKSFENKMITTIYYHLFNMNSFGSMMEAVNHLKESGLNRLGLLPVKDEDYYQKKWAKEFLEALLMLSSEDFLAWSNGFLYQRTLSINAVSEKHKKTIRKLKKENIKKSARIKKLKAKLSGQKATEEKLTNQVSELHASKEYKVGNVICWPINFILRLFKSNG